MQLRRLGYAALGSFFLFTFVPVAAHAEFLTGFTGYTRMKDVGQADGVVSFAVYKNTGDWTVDLFRSQSGTTNISGDVVNLAGSSVDTGAAFVVFYGIVNNGNLPPADGITALGVPSGNYTSAGYLSGRVFFDGLAVQGSNKWLGPDPGTLGGAPNDLDDVPDGSPSDSGFAFGTGDRPFTGGAAINNPDSASLGPAGFSWLPEPVLADDRTSPILYFTTNESGFQYSTGTISGRSSDALSDTGTSDGDLIQAVPEPATLALVGIGMACSAFGLFRRRSMVSV